MKPFDYIIAGYSGLVGSTLLKNILQVATKTVYCVGRKKPSVDSPQVAYFETTDFVSKFDPKIINESTVALCTLGTTIKQAGSKEAFRKIDHDFVLHFANSFLQSGGQYFHLVTAHGADEKSMIFYNQVKGQLEASLKKIPFKSIHIYRPSFLLGDRLENRTGEKIALSLSKVLSPLFSLPGLKTIQPTPVDRLASYILNTASSKTTGIHIHSNAEILS